MKHIEQNFPVVLFIMLSKVVSSFQSVDEILKCDYFMEDHKADFPSCEVLHFLPCIK